jgi:hypothetical protein
MIHGWEFPSSGKDIKRAPYMLTKWDNLGTRLF